MQQIEEYFVQSSSRPVVRSSSRNDFIVYLNDLHIEINLLPWKAHITGIWRSDGTEQRHTLSYVSGYGAWEPCAAPVVIQLIRLMEQMRRDFVPVIH